MPTGAIARRYAGAMFDIGLRQNQLDRTLEDVQGIAQVFAHRTLAYLLREPKVPAKRKETAIRQALTSKVLPSSLNLALLVVQRELVDVMPNIARELEQLVLDYKNEAKAEITTATQIDDAQVSEIKHALEHLTGKTIIAQTNIRPDILGGVIARVGDHVIDGSVRYRLSALRKQLLHDVSSSNSDFSFESGEDSNHTGQSPADDDMIPPENTVEASHKQ
ncbi:MAG TPA: ATP synthase F1 subunit delta [Ktedonobacteraceae bacterium]|nr:ATP synthase F1 subunit delta [Ktedonobacteraceae bacterium]